MKDLHLSLRVEYGVKVLNRNLWRDGDTITFVEERPKLKGSQMISLGGMNAKAKKNDLISLFLRKESDL